MTLLQQLRNDLQKINNKDKAMFLQRFFKTGKGQYAEGDVFIGLTVPQSRTIAKKFSDLPLDQIKELLRSPIHEERLIALLILIKQFQKGSEEQKKEIYDLYLSHTKDINNWDLVDLSAGYIVGNYLFEKNHPELVSGSNKKMLNQVQHDEVLIKLAKSSNLWEKRIAIIATFAFIMKGEYAITFTIAKILLHDNHDLIHKAVGWMLREVGKRCSQEAEEEFLRKHYKIMPRTMLRYAIERFSETKRLQYLKGTI